MNPTYIATRSPIRISRNLMWAAGFIGGLIELAINRCRASAGLRSWQRVNATGARGIARHLPSQRSVRLRDAILGNTKQAVLDVLGAPPTASGTARPASSSPEIAEPYWLSDTWYYPLDRQEQRGI